MVTGTGADRHGIYGNRILDGSRFRYATPDDVRIPTLAAQARSRGLDVAGVGYGMIRPGDTVSYQPPWWVGDWIRRGRDTAPLPVHPGWQRALVGQDPDGRLRRAREGGRPARLSPAEGDGVKRLLAGFACDHAIMSWVAALATGPSPPDLILTEINMTDEIQHVHGYESDEAHFAIASADALVGALVAELERAGRADEYAIAVTSDHGHAAVDHAIFVDSVIGAVPWESEGGTLHVAATHAGRLRECEARLAEHGALRIDNGHVPAEVRDRIATFAAPPGHSFEARPPHVDVDAVRGRPKYLSTHGFRPGSADDERFAVFSGAGIGTAVCRRAAADQFAATAAAILGFRDDQHRCEALL